MVINMRKSSKKNQEIAKDEPFIIPEEQYNYRCSECGYEQEVPDFVVDEFAFFDDLKPGEMPKLECGGCGDDLECVD